MPPRRPPAGRILRTSLALAGALGLFASCGWNDADAGAETEGSAPGVTPVPTVGGVGRLPDPVDVSQERIIVRPPVNDDGSPAALVGEAVDGNRVLLIGDSILASTSSRYGGQMCRALVPLGWQAQVEAEPSRFIDFGNHVLQRLLPDTVTEEQDFDAAVVFLGSNYGGDPVVYEAELRRILDRLAPRPTLLFTVTQYRPNYADVNEVVRRLDTEYDNVTLVDWELAALTPGVLSGDRLHPTDQGRQLIADLVAASLGRVSAGEGECLRSQFRDDSKISGNRDTVLGPTGGAGSGSGSGGSGGSGGVTTTTVPVTSPVTTTAPVVTTAPTVPPTTAPPAPTPPPTEPDPGGGDDDPPDGLAPGDPGDPGA